jgi:hypothetical protein
MAAREITYNQLLAMGIPKPTLHGLLHKLVLAKSYSTKTTSPIKVQENKYSKIILPQLVVREQDERAAAIRVVLDLFVPFCGNDKCLVFTNTNKENKNRVSKKEGNKNLRQ